MWKLALSSQSIRYRLDDNLFPDSENLIDLFFYFFYFSIFLLFVSTFRFVAVANLVSFWRRNWGNCSYLISLSFSSTESQGLRSSLNSRSSMNTTKITLFIAWESKRSFAFTYYFRDSLHPPTRNWIRDCSLK